jgi:lipoprotein-anchoring transpeptidase ErfK/SrfK
MRVHRLWRHWIFSTTQQMNHLSRGLTVLLISGLLYISAGSSFAVDRRPKVALPQQLIARQIPPVINQSVLSQLSPDNASVIVSLSKQRAYVYAGDQVAIDTPVSSGKRAGMTPSGNFTVVQKDKDHRSNIFGNYVDSQGRIVRGGISARIDSAPSGSHFVGAPMLYFMRLTWEGVGMHIGMLPGYPASHGCIRMPADVAPQIYARVKIGTPVQVIE